MPMERDEVLTQLFAERGVQERIAEALGVSRQAVHRWGQVPEAYIYAVAKLLRVKPHRLRPDLFTAAGRRRPGTEGRADLSPRERALWERIDCLERKQGEGA